MMKFVKGGDFRGVIYHFVSATGTSRSLYYIAWYARPPDHRARRRDTNYANTTVRPAPHPRKTTHVPILQRQGAWDGVEGSAVGDRKRPQEARLYARSRSST